MHWCGWKKITTILILQNINIMTWKTHQKKTTRYFTKPTYTRELDWYYLNLVSSLSRSSQSLTNYTINILKGFKTPDAPGKVFYQWKMFYTQNHKYFLALEFVCYYSFTQKYTPILIVLYYVFIFCVNSC